MPRIEVDPVAVQAVAAFAAGLPGPDKERMRSLRELLAHVEAAAETGTPAAKPDLRGCLMLGGAVYELRDDGPRQVVLWGIGSSVTEASRIAATTRSAAAVTGAREVRLRMVVAGAVLPRATAPGDTPLSAGDVESLRSAFEVRASTQRLPAETVQQIQYSRGHRFGLGAWLPDIKLVIALRTAPDETGIEAQLPEAEADLAFVLRARAAFERHEF